MDKSNWWLRIGALLLLCVATAVALPAQTFTTLHSFDGTDGVGPFATLVQATNGNLYGTTYQGGANANSSCTNGCGTIFEITPSARLTLFYSFCSESNCTDGTGPTAGLIQGTDGNFYGTTEYGGGNNICGAGCGAVFRITPSGKLTTLHNFGNTDGAGPAAALTQDTNGTLYGTTTGGGANGVGTVFKITPNGRFRRLHTFDVSDGLEPFAGLVRGTSGDFYGTTAGGGANSNSACYFDGCGTIFKITAGGKLTTLYNFCPQYINGNCTDGTAPYAGLIQGANGDFYGTTWYGGANDDCGSSVGCGTVFSMTRSGKLKTLHSFDNTDGSAPLAGLVQGTDGNFYGATNQGGANSNGTLFKITPSGTVTTLYNFCSQGGSNCTDGTNPVAALLQDTNGKFYGTTGAGGANGDGTVFSLSVGLGPFVKTQPTSGTVGAAVTILGTSLTGSTSVTINGTAATFMVKSKSEITTTVPTGATTGTVQVVTPSGTLSSNVPFTVTP